MRLTTKTDYCLRVLIYLQTKQCRVKIQEIADAYKISKNHLSVAVNQLADLGYVISTPGPKGGIQFNDQFAHHTVGELVSKIEDFNLVECFVAKTNTCNLSPHCKLKAMFHKATYAFITELGGFKIKELI